MRYGFVILSLLLGCEPAAPSRTVDATSADTPVLAEKVAFVERYVTFDRTYLALEYDLAFFDNGGRGVPGPSEWDVRLFATIPASERAAWTAGLTPTVLAPPDLEWTASIPRAPTDLDAFTWHADDGRVVGTDSSTTAVRVLYRNWAF